MPFTLQELYDAMQTDITDLGYQLSQYHALSISELAKLQAQVNTLETANALLLAKIEELTKPKVRTPVVSVRELLDTAQLTITLDATPSATKDKIGREMILLAKQLGFNAVRFMRNKQELATDVTLLPDNPRNLPAVAKNAGLLWFADSMDAVVIKLTDADLKTYCDNLVKAGAVAIYWNDADRASIRTILPDLLKRVRAVSSLPQIGSLSATANLSVYNALFDHVEIQTFGTFTEFLSYVKSPADVLCLDGQASVTIGYLDSILMLPELQARDNISCYTAYDINTRWTATNPVALRYAAFMKKWAVQ